MSHRLDPNQDLHRAQRKFAERLEAATRDIAQLRSIGAQLLSSGLDVYVQGDGRLEIQAGRWIYRPLEVVIRTERDCVYKEVRIPAKTGTPSQSK